MYCTSSYEIKDDVATWDQLRNSPDFAAQALKQYQSQDVDRGVIASAFSGFAYVPLSTYMNDQEIGAVKSEVESLLAPGSNYYVNDLERESAQVTLKQLEDPSMPYMEWIFAPGESGLNTFTLSL